MGCSTSQPEKKILGFTVINFSVSAVSNVFMISALFTGFVMLTVTGFLNVSLTAGLLIWSVLTLTLSGFLMRYRNHCVHQEIKEGLHDPAWGKHIRRQQQRELDDFHESVWFTRPLLRLAIFTGIHKKG